MSKYKAGNRYTFGSKRTRNEQARIARTQGFDVECGYTALTGWHWFEVKEKEKKNEKVRLIDRWRLRKG